MILGITGKIGSGKTLCCEILVDKFEAIFLSTDEISKKIVSNDSDFKFLKDRTGSFLNKKELNFVKNKLHPKVWKETKNIIKRLKKSKDFDNSKIILVETALPSKKFFEICDKTILVRNDDFIKNQLLKKKRSYSDEKIDKIIVSQEEYNDFYNKCDFIIENNKTKTYLKKQVINLLNEVIL